MSCAHLASNVFKLNTTSPKSCTHCLASFGVDCGYLPWPAKTDYVLSCVAFPLRLWTPAQPSTNVGRGLLASPFACTHWSTNVKCGLPASPLFCIYWPADVECGLLAAPLACTQWEANIGCGFHPYFVTCTDRSSNVVRGLLASSISFTH